MIGSQDRTPWFIGILRSHPALLISLVYVVASTIGMLYSWAYLRIFGINVFNYSQIGDFLLASLKEPFTWLIVLISVLVVAVDNAISRRVQSKTTHRSLKWYGSGRYRLLNLLTVFVLVVLFIHEYALHKSDSVLRGNARLVVVQLNDSASSSQAVLLGTTGTFIFLYHPSMQTVSIYPHESVFSISFQAD